MVGNAGACPFCGTSELVCEMVEGSIDGPNHYWFCGYCTAQGPKSDDRETGLRLWNIRTAPAKADFK